MAEEQNIPSVVSKVETVYSTPTFLSFSLCPFCKKVNSDEIEERQSGQTVLTCCQSCKEDYSVVIPEFITQKNRFMSQITVRVPIEVDITYVNKTWYTFRKKVSNKKHYVIGFYQREIGNNPCQCLIRVLDDNSSDNITDAFLKSVPQGSIVYCEQGLLPEPLKSMYDISEFKVPGKEIHVNHVKNLWKDLKRQIKEVHVQVSKKHLELYCGEVVWRTNHRHLSAEEKFNLFLKMSVDVPKRTYKNLTK